jgi:hypothetical protein
MKMDTNVMELSKRKCIPWEEVTVPFDKIGWHNV